ncbi:MAG: hemin receptor [Betaproteobacteria bacterium]|nr:MAG: hemin receptor [Betaproteobacteria bacterium]
MTPEQTRIVQRTWVMVLPVKDTAARLFYDRLFTIDPSLRGLFHGDMEAQGDKLMQVMDAVVNGLTRLDRFLPAVRDLGRRHALYGVKGHHYGAVGAALLWALGKTLGPEFTPEVKDAWATVYGLLAQAMREAGATEEA